MGLRNLENKYEKPHKQYNLNAELIYYFKQKNLQTPAN